MSWCSSCARHSVDKFAFFFTSNVVQITVRTTYTSQVLLTWMDQLLQRHLSGFMPSQDVTRSVLLQVVEKWKHWNCLNQKKISQNHFKELSQEWSLSSSLQSRLDCFVCAMYDSTSGDNSVNDFRYKLFSREDKWTRISPINTLCRLFQ